LKNTKLLQPLVHIE